MKKIISTIVEIALAGALLVGCGTKDVSFDVKSLGSDLNEKIAYEDSLSELDVDTASMFLNLSDINIVNSAIYEGSGATAEEIVVLECASPEDVSKAEAMLKSRVEEQKQSFVDYVPKELTKLDAAVIKTVGNYVVLSVSDDASGATKIIEEYMK